jgi:hypothetical protein
MTDTIKNCLGLRHSADVAGANDACLRVSSRRQAFMNELDMPALSVTHFTTNDMEYLVRDLVASTCQLNPPAFAKAYCTIALNPRFAVVCAT